MKKNITIGKNGVLQLPKDLCGKYNLGAGDQLRLIPVGQNLVFIPLGAYISKFAPAVRRRRPKQKTNE